MKPLFGARSLLFSFAAIALGWMIWTAEWRATELTFKLALVSFVCILLGIILGETRPLPAWMVQVTNLVFALGYAWFVYLMLALNHGTLWTCLVCLAAVLVGLGLGRVVGIERWRVPLLLMVHVVLGVQTVIEHPDAGIDVWTWHNEALQALFSGKNPYAITMPNIYSDSQFYDPTMVVNGRVMTGFQYPPVSLYLAIPGYLLGDVRFSVEAALVLAGACLAYIAPGRFGASAMVLWLFSPRCFFFLEKSWTEGYVVLLLAVTLVCVIRWPSRSFIPLGLMLAVKQYLVFAIPAVWLLPCLGDSAKEKWRFLLRTAAVGLGATLPFILINVRAFIDSIVLLQIRQPFRTESTSLPAWWWATHSGEQLPPWLGFAAIVPLSALALWRCERSASAFAAAVALVSLGFFGLSKQAFGNYYFFTLGAVCCSVAFSGLEPVRREASRA